jgi:hypothetical protein
MKPQDAIFLAGESIPFGVAISAPRTLTLASCRVATRTAAVALVFGGLACLVWVAVGYAAAL